MNVAITSRRMKQFTKNAKQPLIERIAEPQSRTTSPHKKAEEKPRRCKLCSREGHATNDCLCWTDRRCSYCQRPSHKEDECWHKNKDKRPEWWGKPKTSNPQKRPQTDETNIAEEFVFNVMRNVASSSKDPTNVVMPITLPIGLITYEVNVSEENKEKGIIFDESKEGQYYNFENNVVGYTGDDLPLLYYDWLADSATMSHICNQRDAFTEYNRISDKHPIIGVGGMVCPQGRGTIKLRSNYQGHAYTFTLQNVLHVPKSCNNLLSLGRWG